MIDNKFVNIHSPPTHIEASEKKCSDATGTYCYYELHITIMISFNIFYYTLGDTRINTRVSTRALARTRDGCPCPKKWSVSKSFVRVRGRKSHNCYNTEWHTKFKLIWMEMSVPVRKSINLLVSVVFTLPTSKAPSVAITRTYKLHCKC